MYGCSAMHMWSDSFRMAGVGSVHIPMAWFGHGGSVLAWDGWREQVAGFALASWVVVRLISAREYSWQFGAIWFEPVRTHS